VANDTTVLVPNLGSGVPIDNSSVTTGQGAVKRQRVVIGDDNGNLLSIVGGDLPVTLGSAQINSVQSGTWTVGLSSGAQVLVTDGTNTLGTAAHPVRTDPTGTTAQPVTGTFWQATQPISGTVTANQGGAPWSVNVPTLATPPVGQQKVATASTAVQLTSTSTPLAQGVVVQALKANTDQVYVGLAGVTTTHDGTGNGWELQPGQCSPVIQADNANLVYINSATAGSAVCWTGA
jgi:hypothetical protein